MRMPPVAGGRQLRLPAGGEEFSLSILQQNFTRAAQTHTWDEALLYANRLKMYEMLQAFDALPPELVDEFLRTLPEDSARLPEAVNTARIAFAATVVKLHSIPEEIPEGLAGSGQLREARQFLAARALGSVPAPAPPAGGRAGHLFPTPDAAACAAIDEILPVLGHGAGGYGGYILQLPAGLYLFTRPVSLAPGADSGALAPPSFSVIGIYYARPGAADGLEGDLSPADRARAIERSELVFVGTASGKIVRYTPVDMLPPQEQQAAPGGREEVLRIANPTAASPTGD
jgi:hypothetical protein